MKIEIIRPEVTPREASRLVEDLYGVVGEVHELPSERDRNFVIVTSSGERFVLKVAERQEAREILEVQNTMLSRLASSSVADSFPKVMASVVGNEIESFTTAGGLCHQVRLMSFLDGSPLADARRGSDMLLKSLGCLLGRMTVALGGLRHSAAKRDFHWDLASARSTIESLRSNISGQERQSTLDHYLAQYDAIVLPRQSDLRRSVIHNDANDHNIITRLVSIPEVGIRTRAVTGLVDFGDAVESHTINELAVATAYVMLDATDPIVDACQVIEAYNGEWSLLAVEQNVLFTLACMRLCLSVSICALQQTLDPQNEYLRVTERPAWRLLEELREVAPEAVSKRFRAVCEEPSRLETASPRIMKTVGEMEPSYYSGQKQGRSKSQLQRERRSLIGPSLSISYRRPLKIVRGYMQYLYDEDGRAYLDAVNNVPHVGHCHPQVVKAGQRQMELLNTNTRYLHDNLTEYAARLTATMPEPLSVCYFVCSGTEANELAIRLAHTHTGGADFIVIDGAYHGNSSGVVDLSPYKFNGPGGQGRQPHIKVVPTPDTFRGEYRGTEADAGQRYACHVEQAAAEIKSGGRRFAGFFAESILGCAGQIVPASGYLKHAFAHVRSAGGLCIADEVQIGFGRVGTHFWAFETQDVVPDIVTLGKPIGNGHPMAAVITTPRIAASFNNGMEYFNTFGGNPVSCAIGMAVLDVIETESLQQNARRVGEYLKTELDKLADHHNSIGDVRGLGLFLGVELVESKESLKPATDLANEVVEKMKEARILVSTDGPYENVIKIKPPLVFTIENADQLVVAMDRALASS